MFFSFWGFLLVFDAAASVVNYEKSFGTAPQPRKKALMVFKDEELLVFGGMQDQDLWFDDIWAFDLLSGSWTEIFSVNQGPGFFHSGVAFAVQDDVFVAGVVQKDMISDQVWKFSLNRMRWNVVKTTGDKPGNYLNSAMTAFDYNGLNYLCVLPAYQMSSSKNIYLLEIENLKWESYTAYSGPFSYASLAKYNEKVYIFAGVKTQDQQINNSTFTFSLDSHSWSSIKGINEIHKLSPGTFVNDSGLIVFSGLNPSNHSLNKKIHYFRDFQSWSPSQSQQLDLVDYSFIQNNSTFYLFGGRNSLSITNSLKSFDALSGNFKELSPDYPNPGSLSDASLVQISNNLFLFGGSWKGQKSSNLWKYDLIKGSWTLVQPKGNTPSPRSHSGIACQGDVLVIWGGQGTGSYLNDAFSYSFSTNTWKELESLFFRPNQRFGLCLALNFPILYIFGGSSYDGAEGSLWSYSFETQNYEELEERVKFLPGYNQHCELVLESNELFLYVVFGTSDYDRPLGSIEKYSFSRNSWMKVFQFEDSGMNRSQAVIKIINNQVFIIGGQSWGSQVHSKITVVDIKTSKFTDFDLNTSLSVFSSASCYIKNQLFIYGGGQQVGGTVIPSSSSSQFLYINLSAIEGKFKSSFCSPGTYSTSGKCEFCPFGAYNEDYGKFSCNSCPRGTENQFLAGTSRRQCRPCQQGFYSNLTGQEHCLKCPESMACPVGSSDFFESYRVEKITTDQPGALSRKTKEANRLGALIQIAVIIIGVVVLLILFTTEKTRKIVITIDIFNQLHNYELDVWMYFRKTFFGSVFSMVFIILALILLIQTLILYFMDNTAEEKSLIPMVILEEKVDNFYADMEVDVTLYNYGGKCLENDDCSSFFLLSDSNLNYDGRKVQCEQDLNTCTIKFKYSNCETSPGSRIDLLMKDPNAFSSSIKVKFQSESSIPDKTSSITAEIVAEEGKVFRGSEPTVFSYTLTPSLFDYDGKEKTGYHVALQSNPLIGSTTDPQDYSINDFQSITLLLTQDINALYILRYTIYTEILLIMALIGSVVGIMKLIGGAMSFLESNYLTQKSKIKRNNELESLQDNRKLPLNQLTTEEDRIRD